MQKPRGRKNEDRAQSHPTLQVSPEDESGNHKFLDSSLEVRGYWISLLRENSSANRCEQYNAETDGDSDAEGNLQERILQLPEGFGVDGPRIGTSPANRTHAPAGQDAERRDKQKGSNRDFWPRQLEGCHSADAVRRKARPLLSRQPLGGLHLE